MEYSVNIPPLHQKRILAFVNHFLISSCSFLNDFVCKCEGEFLVLERKLQTLEAKITIVEAKLASIPELVVPTVNEVKVSKDITTINMNALETDEMSKGCKAYEHFRYKKFFKMVQVGVPHAAVKLKMESEGLDSKILDNPEKILLDDENL